MKLAAYVIFDQATGAYLRPFFQLTDSQATRSFSDTLLNAESDFAKHPEDYSLWRIGQYDDNKGAFLPEDKECIATALELLAVARNVDRDKMDDLNRQLRETSPGGTA